MHLLHEASKGSSTFWSLYLRQLPRSYSTAGFFSTADIKELQVHSAQGAIGAAADTVRADGRAALPALKALGVAQKWMSKQAWQWASATVSSRTMFVPFHAAGG